MKLKVLSWNVCGLNDAGKRETLKSLLYKWKADVICLQETKIEDWSNRLALQVWGTGGQFGQN